MTVWARGGVLARVAQSVERAHGKRKAGGSNPLSGSMNEVSGSREEHAVLHVRADEKAAGIS